MGDALRRVPVQTSPPKPSRSASVRFFVYPALFLAIGLHAGCSGSDDSGQALADVDLVPDAAIPADAAEDDTSEDSSDTSADSVASDVSDASDIFDAPDAADVPEPEIREPDYTFVAQDLVGFVDPMIGTHGGGNVIPGALVPHGMVRASPVTNLTGDIDAYDWADSRLFGIAHTHLEGPGGSRNGYAHILVTPSVVIASDAETYGVPLDHERESASPGYYEVPFGPSGEITAAVTATGHGAAHRYQFPDSGERYVIVNLAESRGQPLGSEITAEGGEVFGTAGYNVHPAVRQLAGGSNRTAVSNVHFSITANAPYTTLTFENSETAPVEGDQLSGRGIGMILVFAPGAEELELRVGISAIDVEQARQNREHEVQSSSFDDIQAAAADAWNQRLNRVAIVADDAEKTRFYTALYHFMMQPADHTESERFYNGASGEGAVLDARGWRYYSDDWCMWDTFRTSHPLHTLLEPDIVDDFVRSLMVWHDQGGWLPKCPWMATGYSRVMTGNPAIPVIADAYAKGFRGFDADAALAAVVHLSDEDENPFPEGLCGYFGLGTPPEYDSLGYVPHECDPTQAASMTLEYAHADWNVAEFAARLGDTETEARFRERADRWRNHWDEEEGFMRGRMRNGDWMEPFDPADFTDTNSFVEASSWIFSFAVPHDIPGMIEAHGGPEAFVAKLDAFFEGNHFDPTNQPSFHIPFLYAHAGRHDRTVDAVRETVEDAYDISAEGLPGNDDAGSTSAWLVFAALGLYPVNPGEPVYTIASPHFDRAEIFLDRVHYSGDSFVIEAVGAGTDQPYVVSAMLNGEPLDEPVISHAAIGAGGTLVLEMSDTPGSWGN